MSSPLPVAAVTRGAYALQIQYGSRWRTRESGGNAGGAVKAVLSQRVTTRRDSGGTPTGSNCPAPADMPKSVPRVPSGDRHSSSTPDGALLRARRVSLGRRDGRAKA